MAVTLLTLLHLLDLEHCIPVKTLDDLIGVQILLEVLILRVINLLEVNTTGLLQVLDILIGEMSLGRGLRARPLGHGDPGNSS
jgi:hypothetical protein